MFSKRIKTNKQTNKDIAKFLEQLKSSNIRCLGKTESISKVSFPDNGKSIEQTYRILTKLKVKRM